MMKTQIIAKAEMLIIRLPKPSMNRLTVSLSTQRTYNKEIKAKGSINPNSQVPQEDDLRLKLRSKRMKNGDILAQMQFP